MKICLSCEGVTDTQAQRCGHCGALLLPADAVHYPSRRGELDAGNPMLGTVIDGKYRLQSVLGRGGLGTVFRAQHVGSLVTVALKLLHPRFAERPEYRRALLPEARRAATVTHERCARILDVGEGAEGIAYLAMELVEGQTLEEVLLDGPLPPEQALEILLQVSAALSAVHEVGLVHCDLSPRNVMVTARSGRLEAKVLDFGIARNVDIAGREGRGGELWGFASPAFSAPELLAGEDVDARADLYSFGALAWLMLTGRAPVEDSERDRAVEAVRGGQLLPWPGCAGAPRSLVRLIQRCLSLDRELRPSSMALARQRLQSLRSGRGRLLRRASTAAAVAAGLVTLLASNLGGAVFLRPQPGSALQVSDGPLANDARVQDLRAAQLATVEFHYGGIAPERLVAEVARGGKSLIRTSLDPAVDRTARTFVLSQQQRAWRELVSMLTASSREGALDLTFLVPGSAVLGAGRLRVDDEAPRIQARIPGAEAGAALRRDSELIVEAEDDVGLSALAAEVRIDGRSAFTVSLPPSERSFAIGERVAARLRGVAPVGATEVVVRAVDLAGNVAEASPLAFVMADVAAPEVLQITGPAGQRALTRSGDRLRFRVQLSAGEPGLQLQCRCEGRELKLPLPVEASDRSVSQSFDVDVADFLEGAGDFELRLAVVDPVGNEVEGVFPIRVVDRSPELVVQPRGGAAPGAAAMIGSEFVVGPAGGSFEVRAAGGYHVTEARVDQAGRRLARTSAGVKRRGDDVDDVSVGQLAPGRYTLWLELQDRREEELEPVQRSFSLRVLPEQLQVQIPRPGGRFVPQLVDAGVLKLADSSAGARVSEGVGWRYDAGLRPYVRGVCYRGERACASIRAAAGPLLADLPLVAGRNDLSLSLVDVLGRQVGVVDARGQQLLVRAGRSTFASFWWSEETPRVVGEVLLVEHDRPMRVRVGMPLPFDAGERGALRLGLGTGEWAASAIITEPQAAEVEFEVPFAAWSAAAQLAGRTRQAYADGLEAEIVAYVLAPSGRADLVLPLRTTRSTLAPVRLGDIAQLAPALADVRLLPVLAPEGTFVEPVPLRAPPRTTYRPQPATPVRNMADILLQDREMNVAEARALMAFAAGVKGPARAALVHAADPLGAARLERANLLPGSASTLPAGCSIAGVDFFQAWTLTRLLGLAVGDDPRLFRLPLGCELERAAYSGAEGSGCYGAAAHGGAVDGRAFVDVATQQRRCDSALSVAVGDVVPTAYGPAFVGLDFGLREWVLDLPHVAGAELLLREWTGDHSVHLSKTMALSEGSSELEQDPLGLQQRIGVVRGLAFGQAVGVIGPDGSSQRVAAGSALPASVPGVLRTEQLRRDGQALLDAGRDGRLLWVGLRVAADADALAKRWGYR
ncbi:MAG: serine/threonine-protein kinase [Planctomycetota bacterium]|nr:serine/threonine-protein kinase [Planctomycetota bacterium]MEC9046490.1 serine/threonine-protein kinase [Planctomycetota bacterium]